jgi:hypothetical protein
MKTYIAMLVWVVMMSPCLSFANNSNDAFIKYVDSMCLSNTLTVRQISPACISNCDVKCYYHAEKLILLQTMSSGNPGGVETKYYIRDSELISVVEFTYMYSAGKINEYNEMSIDKNGNTDYGFLKRSSRITTISFDEKPDIEVEQFGQQIRITKEEKKKIIRTYTENYIKLISEIS